MFIYTCKADIQFHFWAGSNSDSNNSQFAPMIDTGMSKNYIHMLCSYMSTYTFIYICIIFYIRWSVHGLSTLIYAIRVMLVIIIVGNGHCDPTSNPGKGCLHFP